MDNWKIRTGMLYGDAGLAKIENTCVAVFGVGGVGSYTCEAIARAGIGKIILIDADSVDITNINRQIPAICDTVGRMKVDVMKERILSINPKAEVQSHQIFFDCDNGEAFFKDVLIEGHVDYIVDAIDSVPSKLFLIELAFRYGIKIVSSMGTGNKVDPSQLKITDISKTHGCPLARKVRSELRKKGISHLLTVFSEEEVKINSRPPASNSVVPASCGLMIAGIIINDCTDMIKYFSKTCQTENDSDRK